MGADVSFAYFGFWGALRHSGNPAVLQLRCAQHTTGRCIATCEVGDQDGLSAGYCNRTCLRSVHCSPEEEPDVEVTAVTGWAVGMAVGMAVGLAVGAFVGFLIGFFAVGFAWTQHAHSLLFRAVEAAPPHFEVRLCFPRSAHVSSELRFAACKPDALGSLCPHYCIKRR